MDIQGEFQPESKTLGNCHFGGSVAIRITTPEEFLYAQGLKRIELNDRFCHIVDEGESFALCGLPALDCGLGWCPGPQVNGVCQGCGQPVCATCEAMENFPPPRRRRS